MRGLFEYSILTYAYYLTAFDKDRIESVNGEVEENDPQWVEGTVSSAKSKSIVAIFGATQVLL